MRRLPELYADDISREMLNKFRGYRHELACDEGQMYDMQNLTSDFYPMLSTRPGRSVFAEPINCQGIISKDVFCYVDGPEIVIGDQRISLGLSTDPAKCPKRLISMGAYVIIYPDKKYINTKDTSDSGSMECEFVSSGNVILSPVDANGNPGSDEYLSISATAFDGTVIDDGFNIGDVVKISGIKAVSGKVTADQADAINGYKRVYNVYNSIVPVHHLVIKNDAGLSSAATIAVTLSVTRKLPDMDYICESNNRLWGCRYGMNADGEFINEIYASALGDFKNFNLFEGTAADSYAASLGSDGAFTGCINYGGYPIFFKETTIHKVYGNYPANYQIVSDSERGVQDGCDYSLAIVNDVLFYKARDAVVAYDGSAPVTVSDDLGDTRYSGAVGGAHRNKYYISMCDDEGNYSLFVYDTKRKMWHREDATCAIDMCNHLGELYFLDSSGIIFDVDPKYPDEGRIPWYAESGLIGLDDPDQKYISRLLIRLSCQYDADIRICIDYDSIGAWEQIYKLTGQETRTYTIPIRPRRCDHFRLRFEGHGSVKIISITKSIESGGDRK